MSDKPDKSKADDGTVILSNAPPKLQPQAPARAAAPASAPATPASAPAGDDDEGDVTQVFVQPPSSSESTVVMSAAAPKLGSRPQTPPASTPTAAPGGASVTAPPQPAAAPPPSSQPAAAPVATHGSERARPFDPRSADAETVSWTAVMETAWISLERVLPSDHSGVERIEKPLSVIGRALESDIRLFSASASRRHAQIEQRDGGWYLVPMEGRKVLVDDEVLDGEILLEQGMRLGLGDDVLVVIDQEEPGAAGEDDAPALRWQIVALAAVGSGVALFVLLRFLGLL